MCAHNVSEISPVRCAHSFIFWIQKLATSALNPGKDFLCVIVQQVFLMPEKKHSSEFINYSKLLLLKAIRVFLLMRDLCLALLGKNEEHLPLSKVENSVHLEDVLDLSKWKVPLFLFTFYFLIYWFGWY